MKFRTEIQAPDLGFSLDHSSRVLLLGSCFSDGVGSRLLRDGFSACVNPTGTLYNPLSIARAIQLFETDTPHFHPLFENQGLWRSFDAHSSLADADKSVATAKLADAFASGHLALDEATHIFITFGTARVYELQGGGHVVCNCHKLPPATFRHRLLSPAEIVAAWAPVLSRFPGKHFLFTVSPIRHTADGLHGNQLSKASLLLAIDELVTSFENADYFPAYEALIDDLRDYRFYAPDMKHPSDQAVDYVYDLLAASCFSPPTASLAAEFARQSRRAAHRPLH